MLSDFVDFLFFFVNALRFVIFGVFLILSLLGFLDRLKSRKMKKDKESGPEIRKTIMSNGKETIPTRTFRYYKTRSGDRFMWACLFSIILFLLDIISF